MMNGISSLATSPDCIPGMHPRVEIQRVGNGYMVTGANSPSASTSFSNVKIAPNVSEAMKIAGEMLESLQYKDDQEKGDCRD